MSSLYKKCPRDANGKKVGLVLNGTNGCADLVALYNIVTMVNASVYGQKGPVTENYLKSILNDALEICISEFEGISAAQAKEMKNVLSNIRTDFSLQPRLSGHLDFVPNASYLLCRVLGIPVFHGWVLSHEDSSYDSLSTFSHEELLKHTNDLGGNNDKVCEGLLGDYKNQLTSYGFNSLPAELANDDVALLFCRNRLNIIHKHGDTLYIYVTDEDIHDQLPEAVFMLFEEPQQRNIYFTDKHTPVRGQPYETEAKNFYKDVLDRLRKKIQKDDTELKKKNALHNQREANRKLRGLSQQGQSDGMAAENSEPSETSGNEVETTGNEGQDKFSDQLTQKEDKGEAASGHPQGQDDNRSPDKAKREAAHSVDAAPKVDTGNEVGTTGNEGQDKSSDELTQEEDKKEAASGSHHCEDKDKLKRESAHSVDNVPEGVASEFLSFLVSFKDDGCSVPYFKVMVAAFSSHCPLFYVPYDFIMAHDERLALHIQDNYTRISEDLQKSVVAYLSMNEVCFPNAVLKISGLPEPKSVQFFLDYIENINLHEHYVVYGGHPEALPSYDSRRMALGYLSCIVAKFRTGRCWGGEWSESNMKVKNKGSEFVIDFKPDHDLNPDLGFLDLTNFCKIVLDRLRFNGRLPPYFDELHDDMMCINACFGKPGRWERFLELISYPFALKPPLVRASFVCNVYIAGHAHSSGDPPRYRPLFTTDGCSDWRREASSHQLLSKVYLHLNDRNTKKLKYVVDNWADKHWHLFKFSRHFIQHVLAHTKGDDLIQKIEDISVIDIILSRTIGKSIAKSVRFLVLNCGVDGLFSSPWRHFIGSDYVDKPYGNLEGAITGDMVQGLVDSISDDKGLVDSISDDKIIGYVHTELTKYSEALYRCVLMSDADLTELQKKLNANGFKFEGDSGSLHCGSIIIKKQDHPGAEKSDGHTVMVVEGPYSVEYNSVYALLTQWLGF